MLPVTSIRGSSWSGRRKWRQIPEDISLARPNPWVGRGTGSRGTKEMVLWRTKNEQLTLCHVISS
jgi:hypothetical protein